MELDGRKILIVEDEFLIAFDMQEVLENAGAVVVGPAESIKNALDFIHSGNICAAIVDINLGAELSEQVVLSLRNSNIPFLYHSGQNALEKCSTWPQAPILNKPSKPSVMIRELVNVLL